MNDVMTRLEFDKILNRVALKASFSLGQERVLQSKPSFSILEVNRDLMRLKEAMSLLHEHGAFSFGGIKDVSFALGHAAKGATLAIEDLVDVGRFIHGTRNLKTRFNHLEDPYPSLEDLFESIVIETQVAQQIDHVFGDGAVVLDRASQELKEIRKRLKEIDQGIQNQTRSFLKNHQDSLVENVVTLYLGRSTFLIKHSDKNKLDGTVLGTSSSGQSLYFEPAFLTRLQNEKSQFTHREKEEIERICRELSHQIGLVSSQLEANLETSALLDALFAKASWGLENEGVVSEISDDTLKLVNARHPLIKKEDVISNTYVLQPPHKMILISGPNTGGKSVTLKTIGLFVMMSLAGLPVLADESTVMMVDQIFVDIGDQQSIEKSLSSFSAHLQTISHVIENATKKSLVLLDELGSQTDPLEGEALSLAILDYFKNLECYVVATTHFSKLKKYGTQYDEILIASVAFDLDNLEPTYHYQENLLGESYALQIASRLGIDTQIIEAAEAYKKESRFEEDHLLEILDMRIQEAQKLQESLNKEIEHYENLISDQNKAHDLLIEQIQKEKEAWIFKQEQVYEASLEDLETKIRELDKTSKPHIRHEILKEVQASKPETILEEIKIGDRVQIAPSSQIGTVEKIEKNRAHVSVGALNMMVLLKNLTKVAAKEEPKKRITRRSHQVDRSQPISLECNVIGMRVVEALSVVDKYIDDCVLRRISSCRIVHGVGSGTLRSAIHDALRKNKHVAHFELAAFNEGGAGATKVELKQ